MTQKCEREKERERWITGNDSSEEERHTGQLILRWKTAKDRPSSCFVQCAIAFCIICTFELTRVIKVENVSVGEQ